MKKIKQYFLKVAVISFLFLISCDNANDLLNQYIKDGPVIYAAKINELHTQSGYYRFRVNIYPAEDVNRSYCILSWNNAEGLKDSVRIEYKEENFDNDLNCYYAIINILPEEGIQGNLEISGQNVDLFGNRSLIVNGSAYIYGLNYVSTLINAQTSFSTGNNNIIFEPRVGAVGNLLSYEKKSGGFTEEVFVSDNSYPLTDAKPGGAVRTKTRYHISDTDIDTLEVVEYLESTIPLL
ncbi:MAG: DUF4998 domain-containing protein [bacterium]|nr:DUF4998 domain-containing protein [bacterium]MDD3624748.1 DUF4998 domain-containing protein [Proteiniphilum sp.]MDD3968113.1 DUF4998 domain-containing protein [Proteiniphilum sp.]MDD4435907.1 DUF4998 domain-containing protein [Bacteroidales bacterium]